MGMKSVRWFVPSLAGLGGVAWLLARYVWLARGHVPAGSTESTLDLANGTRIATVRMGSGRDGVVILAHGFLKCKEDLRLLRLANHLLSRFDVIAYDQPGHGRSSGTATMDFACAGHYLGAVAQEARRLGYSRVYAVGVSLGAAAAIWAGAEGVPLDGVVSISSPVGQPWLRERIVRPGLLRVFCRALGTRIAPVVEVRNTPLEAVGRVAPCPLLVVHCGRDTLIPREASEALFRAAREPKAWLLDARALHGTPKHRYGEIVAWLAAIEDQKGKEDARRGSAHRGSER